MNWSSLVATASVTPPTPPAAFATAKRSLAPWTTASANGAMGPENGPDQPSVSVPVIFLAAWSGLVQLAVLIVYAPGAWLAGALALELLPAPAVGLLAPAGLLAAGLLLEPLELQAASRTAAADGRGRRA